MTLSTNIEKLALQISDLKSKAEAKEQELKEINTTLGAYELELAELMASEGFEIGSSIKLSNGRNLKIKEFFRSSMISQSAIDKAKNPEQMENLADKKEQQISWLDENGLGDIVKNKIIIDLDRGENEKARELMLEFQEKGLSFSKDESVHSSTLNAALKKEYKSGTNIPEELFSLFVGTKVEIK